MKTSLTTLAFALASTTAIAGGHASKEAVVTNYANIAHAKYEDSLTTAKALQSAVNALVSAPSAENLQAAKTAWLAARVPSIIRSFPFRQCNCRRLGRQGECMASR